MTICPPSQTSQQDDLLYERYKSLWRRMEDYKSHIKLLQDRIKSGDFEGLTFIPDEELQLTDAPPIILGRHQTQSECELLSRRHSDEKRELQLQFERDDEEMETMDCKKKECEAKETKRKANTKRVNTNKRTEDVKGHIESILKGKFTFISSVVAFNNRAGDVRHLPFVPEGTVYWFTGNFSGDSPIFSPSTREEFEKDPNSYLKKPLQE